MANKSLSCMCEPCVKRRNNANKYYKIHKKEILANNNRTKEIRKLKEKEKGKRKVSKNVSDEELDRKMAESMPWRQTSL